MDFAHSPRTQDYLARVGAFINAHVVPNEAVYAEQVASAPSRWTVPPIIETLKARARAEGLWNLFLPESEFGPGLTNVEYAPICELMGRSPIAPKSSTARSPTRATWKCS